MPAVSSHAAHHSGKFSVAESPKQTQEYYDRQGRLWRVREPSGIGDADVFHELQLRFEQSTERCNNDVRETDEHADELKAVLWDLAAGQRLTDQALALAERLSRNQRP